jgi:hypothetical protein
MPMSNETTPAGDCRDPAATGAQPATAALALLGDAVIGSAVDAQSGGLGGTMAALTGGMLSHLVTAGSHQQFMLPHADVDEESFALRRQVVDDIAALPNASRACPNAASV